MYLKGVNVEHFLLVSTRISVNFRAHLGFPDLRVREKNGKTM